MVKRLINSFGTITIPKHLRDELDINGQTMLMLDIRESDSGIKEIVIRKSDNLNDVMKKYSKVAESLSRILEKTVAVIWNSYILSMSSSVVTDSFVGKNINISKKFNDILKIDDSEFNILLGKDIEFLPDSRGEVLAYYRIPKLDDDKGYFVVLDRTKQDFGSNITDDELERLLRVSLEVVKIGCD